MFLYIFVLAAVIAVVGIIGTFRSTLDNILTEPEKAPQYLNSFFVRVAFVELVPIIMIVLGFVFSPSTPLTMSDAYIPIAIIVILMIFSMFYIFSQRSPAGNVEESLKNRIQMVIFLAMALANAIPIVAIVFIITLVTSS